MLFISWQSDGDLVGFMRIYVIEAIVKKQWVKSTMNMVVQTIKLWVVHCFTNIKGDRMGLSNDFGDFALQ